MLVDQGKVKWDESGWWKHFLFASIVRSLCYTWTENKGLFTHKSGGGMQTFLGETWTSLADVLDKMKLVKPIFPFAPALLYQIFLTSWQAGDRKLSGLPWINYQAEYFSISWMSVRFFLKRSKRHQSNCPHFKIENSITYWTHQRRRYRPAGSVWSCADDISKWVICMLEVANTAAEDCKCKDLDWTFKPQESHPLFLSDTRIPTQLTTYAMAGTNSDYMGKKINYHTGSLAGQWPFTVSCWGETGNLCFRELRSRRNAGRPDV